jgi:uncharacterized membrane protein YdcZ (DUF606 family)
MEHLSIFSILTGILGLIVSILFVIFGVLLVYKRKGTPSYLILIGALLELFVFTGRIFVPLIYARKSVESLVSAQMIFNLLAVFPSLLLAIGLILFVVRLPKAKNQ